MVSNSVGGNSIRAGVIGLARLLGSTAGAVITGLASLLGIVAYNPSIIIDQNLVRELVLKDQRMLQEVANPYRAAGLESRVDGLRMRIVGLEQFKIVTEQHLDQSRHEQCGRRIATLEGLVGQLAAEIRDLNRHNH